MWAMTLGPIPDPPRFFLVAATGRHHRVKRATRHVHPGQRVEQGWVAVLFWCGNLSIDTRGTLAMNRPYGSERCAGCEHGWERHVRAGRHVAPHRMTRRSVFDA